MTEESRREFLLKVAKGAVYAAPVIRTLSAPESLSAQNVSPKGEMKGQDMTTGGTTSNLQQGFGPPAPWTRDP